MVAGQLQVIGNLQEVNKTLQEAADNAGTGDGGDELVKVLERLEKVHAAQLGARDVYTDPYQTGLANGVRLAIATVNDEDLSDGDLLKRPLGTRAAGAKVLSERQMLLKEARGLITTQGEKPALRSGLSEQQVERAGELMKILKVDVPKGQYDVPDE